MYSFIFYVFFWTINLKSLLLLSPRNITAVIQKKPAECKAKQSKLHISLLWSNKAAPVKHLISLPRKDVISPSRRIIIILWEKRSDNTKTVQSSKVVSVLFFYSQCNTVWCEVIHHFFALHFRSRAMLGYPTLQFQHFQDKFPHCSLADKIKKMHLWTDTSLFPNPQTHA